MDLTSTVRSDSLQGVGSILVPGAVTCVPYVTLLWGPPHNLKQFVDANQGVSTAAVAILIVAVGLLVESVGSFVEFHIIDACHKDRTAMLVRWRNYLKIAWKTEPIGQHYLRRILPIFKFELNLFVATLATIPGVIALWYYRVLPAHGLVTIGVGVLLLAGYLFRAAVTSSVLLDSLRESLIDQASTSGELK
jgi:hypothetical protein